MSNIYVEERPGRGRCVVAADDLGTRTVVKVNESSDSFSPLVLPVLTREQRTKRCAICFKLPPSTPKSLWDDPIYPVVACPSCYEIAKSNLLLSHELACLQQLYVGGKRFGPPTILPTAILVFRILLSFKGRHLDKVVSSMQAHERVDLPEDACIHQEAVCCTVHVLWQASQYCSVKVPGQGPPDNEMIKKLWNRIKYNAFTIMEDEIAVGIALYNSPANCFNHSCAPNAVQSFQFQPWKPPALRIEVMQSLSRGEEICITYCLDEPGQTTEQRKAQLYKHYNFRCTCSACAS